ncbi:S-methyl-5-thioribose kinase [Jiella endophytica]|uniref:S-methyl-5-thioribose kinase n=1 Tax=Jiella endophytica TaxID=2558362 RepID=A0A4Y8RU24_9HYPH|nr:S-methyl-5-thioribose kinase [Jiella endophytica]TFF27307.1 S-methyl-5-thioribose kinase [Jiella endophytica]
MKMGEDGSVGGRGYHALDAESVKAYAAGIEEIAGRLGTSDPGALRAREVGDGNLNLVFIVEGPASAVVVKQALPYVRLVGDSWPLPLKRAYFEWNALVRQAAVQPERLPALHHFDPVNALIVMEYLSPHVILRKELTAGKRFKHLAEHVGVFLAETLFRSSDFFMDTAKKKADVALFADNVALCAISENLVFTEPYFDAPLNRWTTPQLDGLALALRADRAVKVGAQEMLYRFTTKSEALLHGDLHTGSIMVTAKDTRIIDPEFAFYGPMGFDIGALLANLYLSYFAQEGHAETPDGRFAQGEWLLETAESIWSVFAESFARLWREERNGILFSRRLFEDVGDEVGATVGMHQFLQAVFCDVVGFAGAKMVRRLVGLAHVEDMESIADPDRRAVCEARALLMGRELLVNRGVFGDIFGLSCLARSILRERRPI